MTSFEVRSKRLNFKRFDLISIFAPRRESGVQAFREAKPWRKAEFISAAQAKSTQGAPEELSFFGDGGD